MTATAAYAERIHRVCDYISAHLSESLDLDRLSAVAHFSKFHFHRQFRNYTGINVSQYIQLLRLKRASYQLVFHPELRVIEIALEACFDSPEAFARAFKRAFGQTPTQFRNSPQWEPWHAKYQFSTTGAKHTMDIQIVDFPHTHIAALEHCGPPETLNNSIQEFISWRKASQLSPVGSSKTFGLVYGDPKAGDPEEWRFDVCGSLPGGHVPDNPQGVVLKEIPAGRCAVLRHLGSRDRMDDKIRAMYGEWLPASGEELRDFPLAFHYLNLFPEVPESKLVTDIYLPLK